MKCKCSNRMDILYNSPEYPEIIYWCSFCGRIFEERYQTEEWLESFVLKKLLDMISIDLPNKKLNCEIEEIKELKKGMIKNAKDIKKNRISIENLQLKFNRLINKINNINLRNGL